MKAAPKKSVSKKVSPKPEVRYYPMPEHDHDKAFFTIAVLCVVCIVLIVNAFRQDEEIKKLQTQYGYGVSVVKPRANDSGLRSYVQEIKDRLDRTDVKLSALGEYQQAEYRPSNWMGDGAQWVKSTKSTATLRLEREERQIGEDYYGSAYYYRYGVGSR